MHKSRIPDIIAKAYGKRYNLEVQEEPIDFWRQKLLETYHTLLPLLNRSRVQLLGATTAFIFVVAAIYYYNTLVTAEHVMLKSASQVEVLMQRRNDISINLAKAVKGYSQYERQVMAEVVKLRSNNIPKATTPEDLLKAARKPAAVPGSAPGVQATPGSPDATAGMLPPGSEALATAGALTGLLAIAEQYPDLKLSANFQSLMAALVEVEKDLSTERLKFNEAVMVYSDSVSMIPSNFFAAIFGFRSSPYFKATQDAQKLQPIAY